MWACPTAVTVCGEVLAAASTGARRARAAGAGRGHAGGVEHGDRVADGVQQRRSARSGT